MESLWELDNLMNRPEFYKLTSAKEEVVNVQRFDEIANGYDGTNAIQMGHLELIG